MRGPGSRQVKVEFLKRWARGLTMYRNRKNNMSLVETKNAIKLSADVAMASTKLTASSQWSRALISEASSSSDTTNIVVQHILGSNETDDNFKFCSKKSSDNSAMCIIADNKKIIRSKKVLRKSRVLARARKSAHSSGVLAATIAKRIVKRRTQKLKSLVPGGKSMDDVSIIKEALDYILSLQLQVNIMRRVVEISELAN